MLLCDLGPGPLESATATPRPQGMVTPGVVEVRGLRVEVAPHELAPELSKRATHPFSALPPPISEPDLPRSLPRARARGETLRVPFVSVDHENICGAHLVTHGSRSWRRPKPPPPDLHHPWRHHPLRSAVAPGPRLDSVRLRGIGVAEPNRPRLGQVAGNRRADSPGRGSPP